MNALDDELAVSPKRTEHLLRVGHTKLYELIAAGELDSFCVGRARRITTESIRRFIARGIAAAAEHACKTAPGSVRRDAVADEPRGLEREADAKTSKVPVAAEAVR